MTPVSQATESRDVEEGQQIFSLHTFKPHVLTEIDVKDSQAGYKYQLVLPLLCS